MTQPYRTPGGGLDPSVREILRILPTEAGTGGGYAIPVDNPFTSAAGANFGYSRIEGDQLLGIDNRVSDGPLPATLPLLGTGGVTLGSSAPTYPVSVTVCLAPCQRTLFRPPLDLA